MPYVIEDLTARNSAGSEIPVFAVFRDEPRCSAILSAPRLSRLALTIVADLRRFAE
jgi:hypothetical protein